MYILLSNLKGQIDPRPPMQASSSLAANGEGFFIQNIEFLTSGFCFLQTIIHTMRGHLVISGVHMYMMSFQGECREVMYILRSISEMFNF